MPILRHNSDTGVPSLAWRRPKATCCGEYRELFMGRSSSHIRLEHPSKLASRLGQDPGADLLLVYDSIRS